MKRNVGQLTERVRVRGGCIWQLVEGKWLKIEKKWPVHHSPPEWLQRLRTVSKVWSVHVCPCVCVRSCLFFISRVALRHMPLLHLAAGMRALCFHLTPFEHIAALIRLSSRDTRRNAGPLLSAVVSYLKKRCFLYSVTLRSCEMLLICSFMPPAFSREVYSSSEMFLLKCR